MGLFAIPYPVIDPVLFEVGPITIRWYALSYVAAILFAWWYGRRLAANDRLWGPNGSPIAPRLLGDFVVWGTLGVVIGGRLGYVLVYDLSGFLADPISIFAIWEGGMSFHGGFIGTAVAMFLFAWRKKIPVWSFIDILTAGVPVGIIFVRLANFVNGELWGRAADVPFAMVFPADPLQIPRHPSQLYEALTEGVLLFIVLAVLVYGFRMLRRPGFITGAFTAGYGVARTFSEFFREPDVQIGFLSGGLTMGMTLSIPMIVAGVIAMVVATRRHRRTAAPV